MSEATVAVSIVAVAVAHGVVRLISGKSGLPFRSVVRICIHLSFLCFQMFAFASNFRVNSQGPLVYEISVVCSLYYVFVFVGVLPPMFIHTFTGKWTMPPFSYPVSEYSHQVSHVVPAVLWLVLSAVQVYTTQRSWWYTHRVLGGSVLSMIAPVFMFTSGRSMTKKIYPAAKPVFAMEAYLMLAVFLSYAISIAFIYTLPKGATEEVASFHKRGHKLSMVACMFYAGGPGIYRFLRSVREIVRGRLFESDRFTPGDDLSDPSKTSPEDFRNFKAVDTTYFFLAYCTVATLLGAAYYYMGAIDPLTLFFSCFPYGIMVVGWFARFIPGVHEDYHWWPTLDYKFQVLRPAAESIDWESISSVADDQAPLFERKTSEAPDAHDVASDKGNASKGGA